MKVERTDKSPAFTGDHKEYQLLRISSLLVRKPNICNLAIELIFIGKQQGLLHNQKLFLVNRASSNRILNNHHQDRTGNKMTNIIEIEKLI